LAQDLAQRPTACNLSRLPPTLYLPMSSSMVLKAPCVLSFLLMAVVNAGNLRGPGGGGFECTIPTVQSIYTAEKNKYPDFTKAYDKCKPYDKFKNATHFSMQNIANAWKAAGMNMDYCAAALVIGAGECTASPPGCNILATGPSGLWQTDWVVQTYDNPKTRAKVGDDAKERVLNPCENARYSYGTIVRYGSDEKYNKGCFNLESMDGDATSPPQWIDCAKMTNATADTEVCVVAQGSPYDWLDGKQVPQPQVCAKCPKECNNGVGGHDCPYNVAGRTETPDGNPVNVPHGQRCNFLGPFCHWQVSGAHPDKPSCCAWTGGANQYQPDGFPTYYQKSFLMNAHNLPNVSLVKPGDVNVLSYQEAQKYCDKATDIPE